jgi:hypothetical protein
MRRRCGSRMIVAMTTPHSSITFADDGVSLWVALAIAAAACHPFLCMWPSPRDRRSS